MGLSPAVVTETVYTLAQRGECPDRVIILTTAEGEERAVRTLLNPIPWQAMAKRLDKPALAHLEPSLEVAPVSGDADPAWTAATQPESLNAFADLVLAILRPLTKSREGRVHMSIAGGRKSMGALASLVFALVARPQDQLSHVQVAQVLEHDPTFLFPRTSTEEALLRLVDIPHLRLRPLMREPDLERLMTYHALVCQAEVTVLPPQVGVAVGSPASLQVNGAPLVLPPREFAFFTFVLAAHLAARVLSRQGFPVATLVAWRTRLAPEREDTIRAAYTAGLSVERVQEHVSHVNRALKAKLSPGEMDWVRIRSLGPRGSRTYGMALPAQNVHWSGPAPCWEKQI